MSVPLTYRLYEENDLPSLLQLWEEATGWGKLTPEVWRQWYVDTPYGSSIVVVAVDENGKILGQEVFTPSLVIVGEQQVNALRLSAPILGKDVRRSSLRSMKHPVIELYNVGADAAVERGYSLVYALPEYAWLPFFQWLPRFATTEYVCVASPIPAALPDMAGEASRFSAHLLTEFGVEYEALWQSARSTFPITCGIVRHPEWLHYKNEGHIALEVRERGDNTPLGYTAIKKQTGLLVDILARTPADLTPVLTATLNWLASQQYDAKPDAINSLKAMETPTLRPALRTLGFAPVDYKFAFVCDPLDSSVPMAAIAPERWYITPGD
jgi:hypothetical protein